MSRRARCPFAGTLIQHERGGSALSSDSHLASWFASSLICPFSSLTEMLPSSAHTFAPSPSELSRRGGGQAQSSAFWELAFYFFKGLSGSSFCTADRPGLIPGLIQSLSPLGPAQHVMAQLGCPCVYCKWLNIREA